MAPGDRYGAEAEGRTHASVELMAAMGDLLAAIKGVSLTFETTAVDGARTTRDEVADQLSDYILPRLVQLDAPLLVVVGGSTGAGKSTLTNSIVGEVVTQAGVLRPTTRSPVLAHHPDDAEWFSRDRILPDLPRIDDTTQVAASHGLRLVPTKLVPKGLGILDAPDVDSIDTVNRELAAQLLAAADLWLFVTSAARYADQVPWDYLKRAADRATSLAVVLDRTADDAVDEVRTHLARMMTSRGLSDSPLFTIPETNLDPAGLLPYERIDTIAGWLHDLAADPKARRMVVGRTLDGAVRHIVLRAHDVADAVEPQIEVSRTLAESLDEVFEEARREIAARSSDGSVLGGQAQATWRRLSASPESSDAAITVLDTAGEALRSLIVDRADVAADRVGTLWAATAEGRHVLETAPAVDRASSQVRVDSEREIGAWRQQIAEAMVVEHGDDVDPAALAAHLVVAVLTSSDGGADHAAARSVLVSALGESAADSALVAARSDLESRVDDLLGHERRRLEQLAPAPDTVEAEQAALRDAARAAEYARHTDFVHGEIAP